MITWKTVFKHYAIGAAALLWFFASLILSVQAFNKGESFYVIVGIYNVIVTIYLAVKGFKYFTNELTK